MKLSGTDKPSAFFLYHLMWEALDWIYPPYCGGCGQFGNRWCETCQSSAENLPAEICPICGNPQPGAPSATAAPMSRPLSAVALGRSFQRPGAKCHPPVEI